MVSQLPYHSVKLAGYGNHRERITAETVTTASLNLITTALGLETVLENEITGGSIYFCGLLLSMHSTFLPFAFSILWFVLKQVVNRGPN